MHFLKLALLAAGASSAAIDTRQSDAPIWRVTKFGSEHIPHSSTADTSFHVEGPGFSTDCEHNQVTKTANGLAQFRSIRCKDPAVTFGQAKVKGDNDEWSLSIHANRQTRYAIASSSFFESPKGSGFTYQRFDLPKSFGVEKPLSSESPE